MITIKKSNTADTRTCDWSKVTKEQLLKSSLQHIDDVQQGMDYLASLILRQSRSHDHTKVNNIDEFHKDFSNGFETTDWWEKHQKEERHHFNSKEHIQDDVNLIDVIEQIVDGVMAGMARSGEYRIEEPDPELLMKAYRNTAKLLLDNVKVES